MGGGRCDPEATALPSFVLSALRGRRARAGVVGSRFCAVLEEEEELVGVARRGTTACE